jgi:hypothetical protein
VYRSHGEVHLADSATGASADEHTRTLVSLMLSNDEVERRGVAPTSNEAGIS